MAIQVGLVGCGNWGKNILRDLVSLKVKVHVADPDPVAQKRAKSMGADQVVESSDQLADLDGYVLAPLIPDLAREAKQLLVRSAPIFSEKTLCTTLADYDDLAAAGGSGRIFVMHKWEYHRGVQTLKQIADSGRIGDLQEIQCYRHNWARDMHGGDVLTCIAVHDLTIIRHILGEIPKPVYASISSENGTPIRILALLGGGPRAFLSVSGRHANYFRTISLHGTNGAASLADALADHILVRSESGEDKVFFENSMPLYDELAEFITYLQGGPAPRCGLEHAREIAVALDALRASAERR